jgi:glycosyltransferase involved in cell wall biosynthesis
MTASDRPRVSVIVATRNAAGGGLPALLAALASQTAPAAGYEVIVVDDGSTDGTRELVERTCVARLITRERAGGAYVARNEGLRVARGSLLAFTDADCVPAADWIERGIAAVDGTGADLVAGDIEVPLGERPSAAALLDYTKHFKQADYVRDMQFGATANLWVRRTVFDRVGPFNERLISGGDREFGTRSVAAGFDLRYAHEVVVHHDPRDSGRELARKAYRLGIGLAQQRRHASGPLRHQPVRWTRPVAYLPRRGITGFAFVQRRGYDPDLRTRLAMHALQYFCMQLPQLAGEAKGTLRRSRA